MPTPSRQPAPKRAAAQVQCRPFDLDDDQVAAAYAAISDELTRLMEAQS